MFGKKEDSPPSVLCERMRLILTFTISEALPETELRIVKINEKFWAFYLSLPAESDEETRRMRVRRLYELTLRSVVRADLLNCLLIQRNGRGLPEEAKRIIRGHDGAGVGFCQFWLADSYPIDYSI